MITRKELLVEMGVIMSYDQLEKDVDAAIREAAYASKRVVTYTFSEKLEKEDIDKLYMRLAVNGYETTYTDPYKAVTIRW